MDNRLTPGHLQVIEYLPVVIRPPGPLQTIENLQVFYKRYKISKTSMDVIRPPGLLWAKKTPNSFIGQIRPLRSPG